ncbi:MAG: hypothetical protein PW843_24960 [Azospirillaceae bacterium]|nr:hypothetical protein [Azospirillaceae bacterium]
MKDAETFLASESHAAIVAAEREITRPERSEFWTGLSLTVVDRPRA